MVQQKQSQKSGEALRLRVRLTIHPDAVGLLDYLKGISPAGLNMEVLQLIQFGYQLRMAMNRMSFAPLGQMLPSQASVEATTAPLSQSAPTRVSENIQVNAAEPMGEGASVASPFDAKFKSMFGPAYERTRNRKTST